MDDRGSDGGMMCCFRRTAMFCLVEKCDSGYEVVDCICDSLFVIGT